MINKLLFCITRILIKKLRPSQVDYITRQIVLIRAGKWGKDLREALDRLNRYYDAKSALERWVDKNRTQWREEQECAINRVVFDGVAVEDALLDLICEGNLCYLKGACIEYIDRKQLWLMIDEILFKEVYFFKSENELPFIIDGGTNIGLAIYYAKSRNENAEILGFEPWRTAYECAIRNVRRNRWEKVHIENKALGPTIEQMELVVMDNNSLASTLTNRMDKYIENNNACRKTELVEVVTLSHYMKRRIDLLKLDIEGMEQQVLLECEDSLKDVKYIFCEYHFSPELENNSLTEILNLLERKRFLFEVSMSDAYERSTKRRHFNHVGKRVSQLIHATNADF